MWWLLYSTVGTHLGCGIVCAVGGDGGVGAISSNADLATLAPLLPLGPIIAQLAFGLEESRICGRDLEEKSPGCWGCGNLHVQFQSEVPPKVVSV